MADMIEVGRFAKLDIENLVEEVQNFSKRERDRLLSSSLRLVMHHLLNWVYQLQKRSINWVGTIQREFKNIAMYFEDNPNLKCYLNDLWINKMYGVDCDDAFGETGLKFS
ncbi:MAG: DUF29 domain-containing protein [Pseudanabaena sp.]|nr:MAG: DUF29 domain-containing protein [Pseudanabaena sp.]